MDSRHVWFKSVNSCNKTKSCFVSRSKTIRVRRGKAYESESVSHLFSPKASTFIFIQRYQCRNRNKIFSTLIVSKIWKILFFWLDAFHGYQLCIYGMYQTLCTNETTKGLFHDFCITLSYPKKSNIFVFVPDTII